MEEIDSRVKGIDETDIDIMEYIEEDFDISLEELSNRLGLSKSAIHYRLNKLRENNIISGISADLDPLAFGLNMQLISEVSVNHDTGYAEEISTQLSEIHGVQQVYYTMGNVDFIVISRVQTRKQMNTLLDTIVSIDGVNETSSRFVMKELENGSKVLESMSDEMIGEILDRS